MTNAPDNQSTQDTFYTSCMCWPSSSAGLKPAGALQLSFFWVPKSFLGVKLLKSSMARFSFPIKGPLRYGTACSSSQGDLQLKGQSCFWFSLSALAEQEGNLSPPGSGRGGHAGDRAPGIRR